MVEDREDVVVPFACMHALYGMLIRRIPLPVPIYTFSMTEESSVSVSLSFFTFLYLLQPLCPMDGWRGGSGVYRYCVARSPRVQGLRPCTYCIRSGCMLRPP